LELVWNSELETRLELGASNSEFGTRLELAWNSVLGTRLILA
jgi:hypothetical protein